MTRTPRTGRPRVREGEVKTLLLRLPAALVQQVQELAHTEDRSMTAVAFRLLQTGLKSEGHALAAPEARVETVYHS
jgi:predicted transcriptional regulator